MSQPRASGGREPRRLGGLSPGWRLTAGLAVLVLACSAGGVTGGEQPESAGAAKPLPQAESGFSSELVLPGTLKIVPADLPGEDGSPAGAVGEPLATAGPQSAGKQSAALKRAETQAGAGQNRAEKSRDGFDVVYSDPSTALTEIKVAEAAAKAPEAKDAAPERNHFDVTYSKPSRALASIDDGFDVTYADPANALAAIEVSEPAKAKEKEGASGKIEFDVTYSDPAKTLASIGDGFDITYSDPADALAEIEAAQVASAEPVKNKAGKDTSRAEAKLEATIAKAEAETRKAAARSAATDPDSETKSAEPTDATESGKATESIADAESAEVSAKRKRIADLRQRISKLASRMQAIQSELSKLQQTLKQLRRGEVQEG